MTPRKKLIEVALPLEAINVASAREKSIRHGHPSTLHLWWARRPLAACRAVIFTSLVDDLDDPNAPPEFVEACRKLRKGANASVEDTPRQRLFDFIETLVQWESTTNEEVLETARELIRLSTDGNPPPLLDPFAGGGSIPLEAQRLGLEAHASDLNPVAVMINKALIEIPPRFANMPPVNPRDREKIGGQAGWKGAQGLAADVRYYGEWMRDRAWERIGHLYPKYDPSSPALLPQGEKGEAERRTQGEKGESRRAQGEKGESRWARGEKGEAERWNISPELERKMHDIARQLRQDATSSEDILWQALRDRQLDGRKFRRQQPVGPFVLDFYCSAERLAVEVDGPIHETQREADASRQHMLESLGIRFVRITAYEVENALAEVLHTIRAAFLPSPLVGEGSGVRGETVIAWLWARTVKCPNPACGAQMPLVRSFELSKKKGRKAWVEPHVNPRTREISFEVQTGNGTAREGTVNRRGATCIACGSPVPFEHVRAEGKAGRMSAQLMAIVTEGKGGRSYYAPIREHEQAAQVPIPDDVPSTDLPKQALSFRVQLYGMTKHQDLFSERQLVALATFSDLIAEILHEAESDALGAGLSKDDIHLGDGGCEGTAYAEAIAVYLAFAISRSADFWGSLSTWANQPKNELVAHVFTKHALPMIWDFAEANPFSDSGGNWLSNESYVAKVLDFLLPPIYRGEVQQADAARLMNDSSHFLISTDPPYYDNVGYGDLSDYFYVWMRRSLRRIYPNLFSTLLVPKEPELIATPFRFGGDRDRAKAHFESGLALSFVNMRSVADNHYPLSVYYAFKQSESDLDDDTESLIGSTGWETMLEGLIHAGFNVSGTWPIRTERGARTVGIGTNALASSIVLVCRPRPDDAPQTSRREFVNALRRELPIALKKMQSGSIAPVDLAQASIGPGMAVYSRYSRVLEADGSPLTVRTALQLINQELDAFLAETEGDVDADTRFCINWFEQFGFKEDEFGRADVLARAKNTSVDGLVNAGVIAAGAGKVRLLSWQEVEPGWTPQEDKRVTVWECVHHLIERINTHGESGAAALLMRMHSDLAAEAKNLAYRLYQICDRKGWAEYALEYNALVLSWPRLQEVANELKQNQPPEQLGLF